MSKQQSIQTTLVKLEIRSALPQFNRDNQNIIDQSIINLKFIQQNLEKQISSLGNQTDSIEIPVYPNIEHIKNQQEFKQFNEARIENLKLENKKQAMRLIQVENNNKILMEEFIKSKNFIELKENLIWELIAEIQNRDNLIKLKEYTITQNQLTIQNLKSQFQAKCQDLNQAWSLKLKNQAIQYTKRQQQNQAKYSKIILEKQALVEQKQFQNLQLLKTHDKVFNEVLSLRRQKQVKKQQIDKQIKIIGQYEKRMEQNKNEIKQLNQKVLSLIHTNGIEKQENLESIQRLQNQLQKQINQKVKITEKLHKLSNKFKKLVSIQKEKLISLKQQTTQLRNIIIHQLNKFETFIQDNLVHFEKQFHKKSNELLKKQFIQSKKQNYQPKIVCEKQNKSKNTFTKKQIITSLKQQIDLLHNSQITNASENLNLTVRHRRFESQSRPLCQLTSKFGERSVKRKSSGKDFEMKQADQMMILKEINQMRKRIKQSQEDYHNNK